MDSRDFHLLASLGIVGAEWWDKMSPEQQKKYIETHPGTKMKPTKQEPGKEEEKGSESEGEKPATEHKSVFPEVPIKSRADLDKLISEEWSSQLDQDPSGRDRPLRVPKNTVEWNSLERLCDELIKPAEVPKSSKTSAEVQGARKSMRADVFDKALGSNPSRGECAVAAMLHSEALEILSEKRGRANPETGDWEAYDPNPEYAEQRRHHEDRMNYYRSRAKGAKG